LYKALVKALSIDTQKMGVNAYKGAENYSWNEMAAKTIYAYVHKKSSGK